MDIITISDPAGTAGDCSGAALQLRYSNPDNTANLLTGTDFVKLIRFIRLWRKLAPLLGDSATRRPSQQTDAILAALYPAAGIPANQHAGQRPRQPRLLDNGFATLLHAPGCFPGDEPALGDRRRSLDRLLACWAPIGTTGPAPCIRRCSSPRPCSSRIQAPRRRRSARVNAGDVLPTSINGGQEIRPTPCCQATRARRAPPAIAAAINAATAPDPVSGLPLSSRFPAASDGGVVTVKAGFTLACSVSAGASETYTAAASTPLLAECGSRGPGDRRRHADDNDRRRGDHLHVPAGDTPATIAAGIAAPINATTISIRSPACR